MSPHFQKFVLTRSEGIPVRFIGELIATVHSPNFNVPCKEFSNRQWFDVCVYRTRSSKHVAHVKYRAGSKLGREEPCDMVYSSPSGETLFDLLSSIVASDEFVVGWPESGHPDANNGRDFTGNDRSVCHYANSEWQSVLLRLAPLIGVVEVIE